MDLALYLFVACLLLALNAFFVLAEFALVKVRSSRIDELIDAGSVRARLLKRVHLRLDEYLSVCQVGITFASIGLGFVAEPAVVRLIEPLLAATGWFAEGSTAKVWTAHSVAFVLAYVLVCYLHILLGELVPKSVAIRVADTAALATAPAMRVFRAVFIAPLWVLNGSANLILRLIGLRAVRGEEHSEDELRIILGRSHSSGLMSFRRLLFMENVFDFGELKVRDAMRPATQAQVLRVGQPWAESLQAIRGSRFSRYPVVEGDAALPLGVLHVKDLLMQSTPFERLDLRQVTRPALTVAEDAPLEQVLTDMQRRRVHVAIVTGKDGRWTGLLSMEDILEEIVGTIEDEFALEPPIYLADVVNADRVVLGLEADGMEAAIRAALARIPADSLPLPMDRVAAAVIERERMVSTYLGRGIAMPHGRLPGLSKPVLCFARSEAGVPLPGRDERAHLLFILLTPAGLPRIHQRLVARIAGILDSDYVDERLRTAASSAEIVEAIRAGEATALD